MMRKDGYNKKYRNSTILWMLHLPHARHMHNTCALAARCDGLAIVVSVTSFQASTADIDLFLQKFDEKYPKAGKLAMEETEDQVP